MDFKAHFIEAKDVLDRFIAEPLNFEKLEFAGQLMSTSIRNGHKIISCGNGGSMCDAMHFAEELTGRFRENRQKQQTNSNFYRDSLQKQSADF